MGVNRSPRLALFVSPKGGAVQGDERCGAAASTGFSGAAVPTVAFLALVVQGADSQTVLAAGVAGVAVILTVVAQYARGRTAVGGSPNEPPRS